MSLSHETLTVQQEEDIMKEYHCFVPGCSWHTRAEEEAEIVRRASEHMRSAHDGMEVRESTVEQIKSRIKDA